APLGRRGGGRVAGRRPGAGRGRARDGRRDDLEGALEVGVAAGEAPDLAAGGLGEARRLDQDDGVDVELVLLGDRPADRTDDLIRIRRFDLALDLVDDG